MIESLSTATVSQLRSEIEATKEALATCEKLIEQMEGLGCKPGPWNVAVRHGLITNRRKLETALAGKGVGVEG